MNKVTSTLLGLLLFMTYSCSNYSSRLQAVLDYSGANRTELEKVLDHYSKDPADSLKLKSAIFLIENMPGHYTFGGPYLKEYCKRLNTLKDCPYYEKKLLQLIPFDNPSYRKKLNVQEDVKCIQSDFLIHNIELAFKQWETRPWMEGIDFDTFKEYLLPYRVENEPLDYWRDSIHPFQERLENYMTYYDDFRYSIHKIANEFYTYLSDIEQKIPEPDLKNFKMDCIPLSKLNLFTLRIIGLPSAIHFIPHFANRNGCHYWATAMDPRLGNNQVVQTEIYKTPKIYRRTFSHNPVAIPSSKEFIPPFFIDPFNKDITDLYIPTSDICLTTPVVRKINHGYLAVFNDLNWQAIACSAPAGSKIRFTKMGKDIVYLPVYYTEEQEMIPFAPPLIVYANGKTRTILANKDSLQKMRLLRKYPNSGENDYWNTSLMNSRFEVADNPAFKNAQTVYTIRQRSTFQFQFIHPDTTLCKRYWRFIGYEKWRSYLADLQFYDTHHQVIQGKIIGMDSLKSQHLFDSDPLSMCQISDWVGMDFGKPVTISKIRYLPRNDANGIYPENDYELFYYDYPVGWVSLGIKTATGYSIEYDQVPTQGLYWLRNRTQGQEERIFTWENGKAHFW